MGSRADERLLNVDSLERWLAFRTLDTSTHTLLITEQRSLGEPFKASPKAAICPPYAQNAKHTGMTMSVLESQLSPS